MDVDYSQLKAILSSLDKKAKGRLTVTAFGGTALTLSGIKQTSRDVDIILESGDATLVKTIEDSLHGMGVSADVYPQGTMPFYTLPDDYAARSRPIAVLNRDMVHIQIQAMDPLDVLVAKIGRFNDRDERDIKEILRQKKYDLMEIQARFGLYVKGFKGDPKMLMRKFGMFEDLYHDEMGE